MQDIKIRKKQEIKTPIKTVDRKSIYKEKLKENFYNIKKKSNNNTKEDEENIRQKFIFKYTHNYTIIQYISLFDSK